MTHLAQQDEMPSDELPSEPECLTTWRLARRPPDHPQGSLDEVLTYIDLLRAHCERLVEENKQYQADFDLIFKRMENHTNHRLVCNANHSDPIGGDMCICVPATLRAAMKRAELAESRLAALREEVIEAVRAEPELPDEMQDEMWEMIRSNRDVATKAFRITVRQTKKEIEKRIRALKSNPTGRETTEQKRDVDSTSIRPDDNAST